MERVDKLIGTFLKRKYGLSLGRVKSQLRSDLLNEVEQVPCNLCGSEASVEIAHKDKYGLAVTTVMCRNCGLMYLNPRPTLRGYERFYSEGGSGDGVYQMSYDLDNVEEILRRYYGPKFHMTDADRRELQDFVREKFAEHIGKESDGLTEKELLRALESKAMEVKTWRHDLYAEEIYRHFKDLVPRHGKVFEVGAAWGKLLVPWRDQHGCEVTGLEPRKATVEIAKSRLGIELFQGFPAAVNIPMNNYDAVLIIRTINHMNDPLADLCHAWRWLKPGGVLIVDISDALREAEYESFEKSVVEIDHTYMFSSKTLAAMMQKAGFQIVKCDLVDTRHVWWGDQREPQYKQIRIAGRKSLEPVTVALADAMQEMAALVQALHSREARLLTPQPKQPKLKSKSRAAQAGLSKVGLRAMARRVWRNRKISA